MRIAVAGGTGQVGKRAVAAITARSDEAVPLSRATGVDITSGNGLAEHLTGVDVIIDCTSIATQSKPASVEFFGAVAANLQQAGATAGVQRIVTLSIVGIDRAPDRGHWAGKLAQEAATLAGDVPTTILRATQFHTFGASLIEWLAKGPLMPCPIQPSQTVDLDTVVAHLLRLTDDGAGQNGTGRTLNLAGPQQLNMTTIVRRTARAQGRRGIVLPVWLPGASERAIRRGAALPQPSDNSVIDGPSFDEWLASGQLA